MVSRAFLSFPRAAWECIGGALRHVCAWMSHVGSSPIGAACHRCIPIKRGNELMMPETRLTALNITVRIFQH